MSYTPTSWNTGDTITAAAMNKIENGIANAGGGGFDAVLTAHKSSNNASWTAILNEGSYDALASLLNDQIPPVVCFRCYDAGNVYVGFGSMVYWAKFASPTPYMVFRLNYKNSSSADTAMEILLHSDNSVYIN